MADTDVGRKGKFHTDTGDVPCWVVEYASGRDGGDHLVAGFSNTAQAPSSGETFRVWAVIGSGVGEFSL